MHTRILSVLNFDLLHCKYLNPFFPIEFYRVHVVKTIFECDFFFHSHKNITFEEGGVLTFSSHSVCFCGGAR